MDTEAQFTVDKDKLEVRMERVFRASRKTVWNAHIQPELVRQWWGPEKYQVTIDKFEPKIGGTWRILHHDTGGGEHWFHGEYKELIEPVKIVRTFVYEPLPDQEMIETTEFEELTNNRTRLKVTSHFPSLEALEGMVASGMEWGALQSQKRLASLIEEVV